MVTLVNQKPIFEWYTSKVVVKNSNERDMCSNEIEQCAEIYEAVKAPQKADTEKTHFSMVRFEYVREL